MKIYDESALLLSTIHRAWLSTIREIDFTVSEYHEGIYAIPVHGGGNHLAMVGETLIHLVGCSCGRARRRGFALEEIRRVSGGILS